MVTPTNPVSPPAEQPCDVCLVLMPYADVAHPSLALGILKACLNGSGIRCLVDYANLRFSERVGRGMPEPSYLSRLLGEWVFSAAAFPDRPTAPAEDLITVGVKQKAYLNPEDFGNRHLLEALENLRHFAIAFVDEVARDVLRHSPRIVGCSSTFEQQCASLALLRRVKELDPSVTTMLGGANCEGEMGWTALKEFPWLDYVVSGEADELFLPLCRAILGKNGDALPVDRIPHGAMGRAHAAASLYGRGRLPVPRATVQRLDLSPTPDFSDYFAALARSPLAKHIRPGLLVETSRGCWWGQKSHCTFCGINGGGMNFRRKSADRALAELRELAERYGVPRFMVVDNIIDMGYFKSLLPELARRNSPYELFYETKANLRRNQVRLLHEGGIVWIQPGIEGFHDDLLRLMAKGNSAMTNLQLLKYTREFGIHTTWLLLFGFPGEDDEWHAQVAEWLPLIFHLQPPRCVGRVLFDRFSVYHQHPERFGLALEAAPPYRSIYPLRPEAIRDLAYFFVDAGNPDPDRIPPGAAALTRQVVRWVNLHKRPIKPVLCMTDRDDSIEILDRRPCATARSLTLDGLGAAIHRACEPAVSRADLSRRLAAQPYPVDSEDTIDHELQRLVDLRLLLHWHGNYLALAVPGGNPAICRIEDFPGGASEPTPPINTETLGKFALRMAHLANCKAAPVVCPRFIP